MKKITLINNSIKFRIDEWVIDRIPMNRYEVEEFFSELTYKIEKYDKDFTLENIQNMAYDYIYEYADECLPIYNYEIMEIFGGLDHWQIDEVVQESGWIEYNPEDGFISFAKAVISQIKAEEFGRALAVIFEEAEFIEIEREDMEEVKKDIINYLETYRDIDIERMARDYKEGRTSSIEWINEYICTVLYCSYQAVGYGENLKGWDVYKYYYIDLYYDEDIKKAILEY